MTYTVATEPHPSDILSRQYAQSDNAGTIAIAIQPWILKNPRFTDMACYKLLGLVFPKDSIFMLGVKRRLNQALKYLNCKKLPQRLMSGEYLYESPGAPVHVVPDVACRVTMYGFTECASDKPPAQDQIDVCQRFIKEFCRPRSSVHPTRSAVYYQKLVQEWSLKQPEFATQRQYDDFKGEYFYNPMFFVMTGAFIQAAINEGYDPIMYGESNALFNISVRRDGQGWRGRPPVAKKAIVDEYKLAVARKVNGLDKKERVAKRFAKYLDKLKLVYRMSPTREHEPFFTNRNAGRAMGITVNNRTPNKMVLSIMREAGCVSYTVREPRRPDPQRSWLTLPAVAVRVWVRFSDMPTLWQQANWKLQEQLQKKEAKVPRIPVLREEQETQKVWDVEEDEDEDSDGGVWNPDA